MFSLPVSPPPASIMIIDAGVCGPRSEKCRLASGRRDAIDASTMAAEWSVLTPRWVGGTWGYRTPVVHCNRLSGRVSRGLNICDLLASANPAGRLTFWP